MLPCKVLFVATIPEEIMPTKTATDTQVHFGEKRDYLCKYL